jgi:predicted Zn finger-like uncharacterized protein
VTVLRTPSLADSRKGKPTRHRHPPNRFTFETLKMRRSTPSTTGSHFTVRGQLYVQTGAFFHAMSNDREVRVLELATTCPECAGPFRVTASMRQIKTRQLVRRCPTCRKIHTGPVSIAKPVARKTVKKKAPGRKMPAASRRLAVRKFEPPAQITLVEIRPAYHGKRRRRRCGGPCRRRWTDQPSRRRTWHSASGATPWTCSIRTERSTHRLVF